MPSAISSHAKKGKTLLKRHVSLSKWLLNFVDENSFSSALSLSVVCCVVRIAFASVHKFQQYITNSVP